MLTKLTYYPIFGLPLFMYIGILALFFVLLTTLFALINKKGKKLFFKLHHRMAALSIVFALIHGTMGMYGLILTKTDMTGSGQGKEFRENFSYPAGLKLFDNNCKSCHPKGGNIMAPDRPLRGSPKLADFETFLAFIRNPGMPDGPKGLMPAFSQTQISDSQARELYRYLISEQELNQ